MRKLTLPLLLAVTLLLPVLTMVTGDEVAITDAGFVPQVVTVQRHCVVTWTNAAAGAHTVTADGYEFGSGCVATRRCFHANISRTWDISLLRYVLGSHRRGASTFRCLSDISTVSV